MKKIALIIAALLVVCLMATACKGGETSKDSTVTSSSKAATTTSSKATTTTSSNATTPASSATAPASSNITPAPGGSGEIASGNWMDFATATPAIAKGTAYTNQAFGAFTCVEGKGATSSGKTVKEGQKSGTSFTAAVQVKGGSASAKCLKFIASATGCVEVYVNCGSTGMDGIVYFGASNGTGTVQQQNMVNANIKALKFNVVANTEYSIWSDQSANIWGVLGY